MADRGDHRDHRRRGRSPFIVAAAVYRWLSGGGETPAILEAAAAVQEFGAQAVYGRALGVGEIRSLDISRKIQDAFLSRQASGDWVEWATTHQADNGLLIKAVQWAEKYLSK